MANYEGKNIWIIGASSGIGHALAVELAKQGAALALSARSADKLQSLNADLGGNHHIFPLDVADADAFVRSAKAVQEKFSKLDSVIFMAATYNPAPLSEADIRAVHNLININLNGAIHTVHSVLPMLKKQKYGQLALCASVAGYSGLPKGQPYSCTKAAIINLAESLKAEEPGLDIKVINPGFVRTPMTDLNKFKMPMIIEASEAARIISKELLTKKFEIHFPKKFTCLAKLLKFLPYPLYFWIVRKAK
jgi:short-subunit dehydrogenase